jgi:hypothetical protein
MADVDQWACELGEAIAHTISAHSAFANADDDKVRFWDRRTPYAVHPIWCAMTLLTETRLPAAIRERGYLALLWHDVLEDTRLGLPTTTSEVRSLVEAMTFASFAEEKARVWEASDEVKLLKLYDKVSNLLDASWMSAGKRADYVEHTQRLAALVRSRFGELNITRIADAICRG